MQRLSVVAFALLAACELQPTPKQQAPAPAPPAPVTQAPADAGVVAADAPPQPVFSDQCREVGAHIADIIINSATDPGVKSIYEQDRAKIVRSTAETCGTQGWTDVAVKCYLKANTAAELKACETKYTPPQPRARPPSDDTQTGSAAGSGSAAAPRAGAGSAAPRAGAGSAAPRAGAGSAATPRAGAGSAAAPRARAGAGSGSGR